MPTPNIVQSFPRKKQQFISIYIWITFFFPHKKSVWQEKLTTNKILIFLCCTPLLLDKLFFTRFFHATGYTDSTVVLQQWLYYRCILGALTTSSVLSLWRLLSLKRLHDLQHNSVVKVRRTGNFRAIESDINIQCIPLSLMTTSLFLVSLVLFYALLLFTEFPLLIFMFFHSGCKGVKHILFTGQNSSAITWTSSLASEILFLRILFILCPYLDTYSNYLMAASYMTLAKVWFAQFHSSNPYKFFV